MNPNPSSSILVILSPDLLGLFVVQLLSHVGLFATHGLQHAVFHYLLKFAQIHVHWVSDVSNHLILCHPLFLLPSIFPHIRVFSNELALHIRWPKYWSFSFTIKPSMNIQGWFPSGLTHLISKLSKGLSGVFSSITIQKHQFFGAQPSLCFNSHIHTWLLEKL